MKIFDLAGRVKIGLSDKSDGNMKVFNYSDEELEPVGENRQKLMNGMGIKMDSVSFVRVGYVDVEDFCIFAETKVGDERGVKLDLCAGQVPRVDGLLTKEVGNALFLPLADCLGLVLYDENNEVLMMVHCGRHTVEQEGALKAVKYMQETARVNPADIWVWMSPSAGKENFPLHKMGGISMQEAVIEQLLATGVLESNIVKSDVDTTKDESYWSHSQGDLDKRFAIVAVTECSRTDN
jgi:copper oxidase (laccase) domain-containing protein